VFSAWLLHRAQGRAVPSHRVLLAGRGETETFRLADFADWVAHLLEETRVALLAPDPPVFAARWICRDCEWRRACFDLARRENRLGRVFGISSRELAALERAGFNTLDGLAAGADRLGSIEELTADRRVLYAARAEALGGRPDRLVHAPALPKNPFLLHLVRDCLDEKALVAFAGGFRAGPAVRFAGPAGEVRARLVVLLSREVPLRQVLLTTEQALGLLRDEVIDPLLGPANPALVAELPHLVSLEGLASRCLALDLEVYDYVSLAGHFGAWPEGAEPPELAWAEAGPGERFERAGDTWLEAGWKLCDAMLALPGGRRD